MQSVEITLASTLVRAYCDHHAVAEAKALLVTLQDRVRQGFAVKPEARLMVGWTHFLMREHEGALVLHEPNYATNPLIAFRRDVTTSVLIHRDMIGCAHNHGVQPAFPRYMDLINVSADWRSHNPLPIARSTAGWQFAGGGSPETLHVYDLIGARPSVLPYLALPIGTQLTVA